MELLMYDVNLKYYRRFTLPTYLVHVSVLGVQVYT